MTTNTAHDDPVVDDTSPAAGPVTNDILDDPLPPLHDGASRIADAAVEQLRARRFSYGDERRQMEMSLSQDTVYSEDCKQRLMEGFTETAEAEARALATREWRETLAAEEGLAEQVAHAAQAADAGLDHTAVATFSADYSSRLSMSPPATGADERTDSLRYIASLAEEVEGSRSPERMRAFRVAAAPIVRSLVRSGGVGTTDGLARDLDRRLASMALRERGTTPVAEQRLARVRQRKAEVRYEILNRETAMTGARPTMFAPVTPWASRILGETIENHGGGVHDKGKPRPYGPARQSPTPWGYLWRPHAIRWYPWSPAHARPTPLPVSRWRQPAGHARG